MACVEKTTCGQPKQPILEVIPAEDICKCKKLSTTNLEKGFIHRLRRITNGKEISIYPITALQAVYDCKTGERLDSILGRVNHLYLPINGCIKDALKKIPLIYRRKGLVVTYYDLQGNIKTIMYNKVCSVGDEHWVNLDNWSSYPLSTDIEKKLSDIEDKSNRVITRGEWLDNYSILRLHYNDGTYFDITSNINNAPVTYNLVTSGGTKGLSQGTSYNAKLTWELLRNGSVVVPYRVYINNESVSTTPPHVVNGITSNTDFKIDVYYENRMYTSTESVVFTEEEVNLTFTTSTYEFNIGDTPSVELRYSLTKGGREVQPFKVYLDNVETSETPIRVTPTATTTYNLRVVYEGKEYTKELTVRFEQPQVKSYYSVKEFSREHDPLTASISWTSPAVVEIQAGSIVFNKSKAIRLTDLSCELGKVWYAYPKSFGELTSIKDLSNIEYITSFRQDVKNIQGVDYYVYTSKDASALSNYTINIE